MVALVVILFPPLVIAFLLIMERVEEPLRRPTSQGEVEEFLGSATAGDVGTLANSGIRRAMARWRARRHGRARRSPEPALTDYEHRAAESSRRVTGISHPPGRGNRRAAGTTQSGHRRDSPHR